MSVVAISESAFLSNFNDDASLPGIKDSARKPNRFKQRVQHTGPESRISGPSAFPFLRDWITWCISSCVGGSVDMSSSRSLGCTPAGAVGSG